MKIPISDFADVFKVGATYDVVKNDKEERRLCKSVEFKHYDDGTSELRLAFVLLPKYTPMNAQFRECRGEPEYEILGLTPNMVKVEFDNGNIISYKRTLSTQE